MEIIPYDSTKSSYTTEFEASFNFRTKVLSLTYARWLLITPLSTECANPPLCSNQLKARVASVQSGCSKSGFNKGYLTVHGIKQQTTVDSYIYTK